MTSMKYYTCWQDTSWICWRANWKRASLSWGISRSSLSQRRQNEEVPDRSPSLERRKLLLVGSLYPEIGAGVSFKDHPAARKEARSQGKHRVGLEECGQILPRTRSFYLGK